MRIKSQVLPEHLSIRIMPSGEPLWPGDRMSKHGSVRVGDGWVAAAASGTAGFGTAAGAGAGVGVGNCWAAAGPASRPAAIRSVNVNRTGGGRASATAFRSEAELIDSGRGSQ